ncbi:unnamed protein product [Cuscuta epithymum]|uniref:Uncharacterized protein n=1 Tax=Cuscuta epithymum TaxID=186058 RepID=A0AAV0ESX5_9ASTE|nr:unnamed protein product [Cuscuta epithymum]
MPFEPTPTHVKSFSDISKVEVFSTVLKFKRWQECIFSTLDNMPDQKTKVGAKILPQWTYANKVCRRTILSTLSNELFDVYCNIVAKKIWGSMIAKYTTEDSVKQSFVIGNYYKWEMKDDRDITTQIHEYLTLLEHLKGVQIDLPESFIIGILIEKLAESWRDYGKDLKHNVGSMSFNNVITNIIIDTIQIGRPGECQESTKQVYFKCQFGGDKE